MIASNNTQLLSSSAYLQTLMDNAINAQKSKDYNAVVKHSLAIVATSPNNSQARLLLAMYNGWDQKLCAIDENLAVNAVRRFFQKYASNYPYKEAQEIYEARREQVFCTLDSEVSMPSFSNTKELHRTMLLWLRLLEEIPYLSPELIKGEIERAERICEKSKRSFDPRLRTIYAAYSSFNDKLPYGVSFSAALSPVIERAALRGQANVARIVAWAESCSGSIEAVPDSESEQEHISHVIDQLSEGVSSVEFAFGLPYYKKELNQLNEHLSSCKPFSISMRRKIKQRMQILTERLSNTEHLCKPQLDSIKKTIDNLGASLEQDM